MDAKQAARSFLQGHSVGVLSTVSEDGKPRSRTVYYSTDDDFAVYFFTLAGTRKVEDLTNDAHGAFVVSAEDVPQTLQIEGTIADLTETATITEASRTLVAKLQERGPTFAPLTHLPMDTIRFYKLTPTWVRMGDFTSAVDSEHTFTEITL